MAAGRYSTEELAESAQYKSTAVCFMAQGEGHTVRGPVTALSAHSPCSNGLCSHGAISAICGELRSSSAASAMATATRMRPMSESKAKVFIEIASTFNSLMGQQDVWLLLNMYI